MTKRVEEADRFPATCNRWSEVEALEMNPERMFTTPAPSSVKRSLVPRMLDEEILNFPKSLRSMPMEKVEVAYPAVLVASNPMSASLESREVIEIRFTTLEVPMLMVLATKSEEEALRAPATCNPAPIDDDALEMNPPKSVERLDAMKVEDAERLPATWRFAPMEEEALEINPPLILKR